MSFNQEVYAVILDLMLYFINTWAILEPRKSETNFSDQKILTNFFYDKNIENIDFEKFCAKRSFKKSLSIFANNCNVSL